MPPEYGPTPVEPHQTARGVRAGLLIALAGVPSDNVATMIEPCIVDAIELMRV